MQNLNSRIVIPSLLVIIGLGYFIYTGLDEGRIYYVLLEEVTAAQRGAARLRVAGFLSKEGVKKTADGALFEITHKSLRLAVRYTGNRPLPDTLVPDAETVVTGHYEGEIFVANQVQAKCASKYEKEYIEKPPPDIKL